MDFTYNDNQKMIKDMVKTFGKKEITPNVREWDDHQIFPIDIYHD